MPPQLGATLHRTASFGPKIALERPDASFIAGVDTSVQGTELRAAGPRSGPPRPALLPCPNCNNSTELNPLGATAGVAFPQGATRTAYALGVNVEAFVLAHGIENVGFLTLTFADHVLDPKEAQRRMNSLTTHVLRPRYASAIRVFERQKSGRIHYHLLVDLGKDIRTGFDFAGVAAHDYRSAGQALRAEWAFWRRTAKAYGFGRTELMPVKSSGQAIGKYIGKYIAKHLGVRKERDLGVRLVSYVGARVATCKFAWAGVRSKDWREALGSLVRDLAATARIDSPTFEGMKREFGKSWAWKWRDIVAARASALSRNRGEFSIDGATGEILNTT